MCVAEVAAFSLEAIELLGRILALAAAADTAHELSIVTQPASQGRVSDSRGGSCRCPT